MNIEVKLDDTTNIVNIVTERDNIIEVTVNGKLYKLDIVRVEKEIYSVLYNNKSYNLEIIEGSNKKKMTVNTLHKTFDIEIVDAESRYQANRDKSLGIDAGNIIASPMPGRIVRIQVKPGDEVKAGETVIIVSAMKMESEYKSPRDAKIKEVLVKEGEVVQGHQPLIVLE